MPIRFISLNTRFNEKISQHGYEALTMKIQDYVPRHDKHTYYVSPANSLCFMDGGFDYALSRTVFPGIETEVKRVVRQLGIVSIIGKPYLPIGSSILLHHPENRSLVVAPTMLLPQDVSQTQNAYYATQAVLYIIQQQVASLDDVDILLTSFCCGYGKMEEETAVQQILLGIRDFPRYVPTWTSQNAVVHEPNLIDQPKYYQNTEFFSIPAHLIVRV